MKVNNVNLHLLEAGPPDGPLVILLHGFPEFWYGWRHQITALAQAGCCVWAPDQRGYNRSEKPTGLDAYNLDVLAADVAGLIEAAGRRQAFLVGHDWGAAVTWRVAHRYPDKVARAAILNVPHPYVMFKQMRSNLRQFLRSTYILFFQIPRLPEWMLARGNWHSAVEAMRRSARPGLFTDADFARYCEAWAQPGAMTAMLNWYRAALQRPVSWSPSPRIKPPVLLIWGDQDRFLGKELAQPSIELCDDGRLVFVPGASHWVQHEAAERVNKLLLEHFAPDAGRSRLPAR